MIVDSINAKPQNPQEVVNSDVLYLSDLLSAIVNNTATYASANNVSKTVSSRKSGGGGGGGGGGGYSSSPVPVVSGPFELEDIVLPLVFETPEEKIADEVKELIEDKPQETITILVRTDKELNDKIKNLGGKLKQKNSDFVSLEIPANKVEDLAKESEVQQIYPNLEYSLMLENSTSQFGVPFAWNLGLTGKGVKVAVLDTGIDSDNKDVAAYLLNDFSNSSVEDNLGHGTHIAGIISSKNEKYRGVAPDAALLIGKVIDDTGRGGSDATISAIYWAVENKAKVISLSLGRPSSKTDEAVKLAIVYATYNDVSVVVAAGNCGNGASSSCGNYKGITSPGNLAEVITVGSINPNNLISSFSSRGNSTNLKPDLVAPGENIVSTGLSNQFVSMSGTSMSVPFISGTIALLLEKNPALTNKEIKQKLISSSIDLGDDNFDLSYGFGLLNYSSLFSGNVSSNQTIPGFNSTETKTFDLSNYPDLFIENNSFNGVIVVGKDASSNDVASANGIIEGLSYETVPSLKLSDEISNPFNIDLISVGNPCNNNVSAQLMGNNVDCSSYFSENESRILLYNNNNHTQIVVAGYSDEDTMRASLVLANWSHYSLEGTEVLILGNLTHPEFVLPDWFSQK